MKTFKYSFSVPATNRQEAEAKLTALASLSEQLDAKTLRALANKVPSILRDPFKSKIVKAQLGI